jgi:hypothetical protein
MKRIIHVNQHIIKANTKNKSNDPPLTVRAGRRTYRAHSVTIPAGALYPVTVVHSPHNPLPCGARVWIETENQVDADGRLV